MSDIPELSIRGGLGTDLERIGPFVDVHQYKKIRLCVVADTILLIQLEWSPDGETPAISTSFRCPSDMYKSESYDVILPYVRLKVQNHSGKENNKLSSFCSPTGVNSATSDRGFEQIAPALTNHLLPAFTNTILPCLVELLRKEFGHVLEQPAALDVSRTISSEVVVKDPIAVDIKERSKSPFFRKKKEVVVGPKHTACVDHRLPQFLPVGCILVGDKQGRAVSLPKGLPGDVLKIGIDGLPHWVSEFGYPPISDERTTKLLEEQRKTVRWEKEEE